MPQCSDITVNGQAGHACVGTPEPTSTLNQNIANAVVFAIIGSIICCCCLVGGAIAFYFYKRNNNPTVIMAGPTPAASPAAPTPVVIHAA